MGSRKSSIVVIVDTNTEVLKILKILLVCANAKTPIMVFDKLTLIYHTQNNCYTKLGWEGGGKKSLRLQSQNACFRMIDERNPKLARSSENLEFEWEKEKKENTTIEQARSLGVFKDAARGEAISIFTISIPGFFTSVDAIGLYSGHQYLDKMEISGTSKTHLNLL